jgi:hypothetical protein
VKIVTKITLKQLLTEEEQKVLMGLTEYEQYVLLADFRQNMKERMEKEMVSEGTFEVDVKAVLHK